MSALNGCRWRDKIRRRTENLAIALKALFREPNRQPWPLIIKSLVLPSEKWLPQMKKHYESFIIDRSGENNTVTFDFKTIKVTVPACQAEYLPAVEVYFDIIYPFLVRNPLPSFFFEGPYEYGPVALNPADVVLDIGANVGVFSFLAGRKVGPGGAVYGFEPSSENFQIFLKTLEINGRPGNVFPVQKAVGQSSGTLKLYLYGGATTGVVPHDQGTENVPVTTIDEFVAEHNLTRVDFIKMDIEGMERDALKGAYKTLQRFKPKLSICTYHLPGDSKVIPEMVRDICPDYQIIPSSKKAYAWAPEK